MLIFPKLEFKLFSNQKRKVRIHLILHKHFSKKFKVPLPFFINPSFWNAKNQNVKLNYKDSEEINLKLKIILNQKNKIEDLEKIEDLKALKKIVLFHIKRYVLKKE